MAGLNLSLTLNKSGSITSTWSKVPNVLRYELFMFNPGSSVAIFHEKNLTVTTYTSATDLPDNMQYKVVLTAYDTSGMYIDSAGETVLIPLGFYDDVPLGIPKNVTALPAVTSVTIKWDGVVRATGYDILFQGTTYSSTGTNREITGLTPQTNYSYSVRAKNSIGVGAYSIANTVRTLSQTPPVPINIRGTVTENSVTISWNASIGATNYDLLFQGIVYNVVETSKTITGLASNTRFSYAVRAKNSYASSGYSSTLSITTAPLPPASVVITGITERYIKFRWNPVSGAGSYYLRLNEKDYLCGSNSFEYNIASGNTLYTYQVASNNGAAKSSYTPLQRVTTPPNSPGNVRGVVGIDFLEIRWDAVGGATSYDINVSGNVNHTAETSYILRGLTAGTLYRYQIRSIGEHGTSEYSNPAKESTTFSEPPTNITATAAPYSVTVNWTAANMR